MQKERRWKENYISWKPKAPDESDLEEEFWVSLRVQKIQLEKNDPGNSVGSH